MKNYFKKFSIMFVILLAVLGIGTIQNGNVANADTVRQQLKVPESGWQRYDNIDSRIKYTGTWTYGAPSTSNWYNNTYRQSTDINATASFKFYGSKLRIILPTSSTSSNNLEIKVDGITSNFNGYSDSTVGFIVAYENLSLKNGIHEVFISNKGTVGSYINFDAIDMDETGYLVNPDESISLDKSSMDLTINESKTLVASTTPTGVAVTWSSSDESVATVDENGNVTGVKEGQVTITATINDGSNVSATCTVNVIPKATDPTEPQDPTGGGTLFIELVDGNIKSYDVSSQEITNFINWYKNRDLDDSQSPVYKFKKGDYTDYVVHDKIDWFEVR